MSRQLSCWAVSFRGRALWSAGAGWKNPLMGGKALSRVDFHASKQAVGLVLSRSEIVPGFLPS